MPRQVPEEELMIVEKTVSRLPGGAGLDEIFASIGSQMTRRTIQRRLQQLVDRGRLRQRGTKRWTRYVMPDEEAYDRTQKPTEAAISLGSSATRLRALVTAPLTSRHPVGYNRSFLDAYRPNTTCYLPEKIRRHLATIGGAPPEELPAGTYIRQVYHRLLIDLTWNSSRLEGNTYSLLETERLLEMGESAEGKNARDAQMILNHKSAIEEMVEGAGEIDFNRYTIRNLHALLSDNLLADQSAGGRTRSQTVGISGSVYLPPDGEAYVAELFDQVLDTARAIVDPFEQSFFAMVHLPYLQPFDDVNKRVSRLAANIPLIRHNLSPLSFVDVPRDDYIRATLAVYELNRIEYLRDVYVWAYERSCARYAAVVQSLGDPDPFILRHRTEIKKAVAEIVRSGLDKKEAADWIREKATSTMSPEDRERFITVVETEMTALHEGNIARYRLRPSEFSEWKKGWR